MRESPPAVLLATPAPPQGLGPTLSEAPLSPLSAAAASAASAAGDPSAGAADTLRQALLRRQLLALLGHEPASHPTVP